MTDQIPLDNFSIKIKDRWDTYSIELRGIDNMLQFFKDEFDVWNSISNRDQLFQNYVRLSSDVVKKLEKFKKDQPKDINESTIFFQSIEENLLIKEMCFSHSKLGKKWLEEYKKNADSGKCFTDAIKGNRLDLEYNRVVSYFKALFILEFEKDLREGFAYDKQKINEYINNAESILHSADLLFKKYEDKLQKLTESYEKKLHLEEPVKLWKKRKFWLTISGSIWMSFLFLLIFAFLFAARDFLYNPPAIILNLKSFLEPNAIKVFLIIITCVSIFGFSIGFLAKFAYSTFHLRRDADERRVLTDFYLSMLMQGKIEQAERSLIIQALFSRVDTGLLKGDSSPAMPNSILEKLIENAKPK